MSNSPPKGGSAEKVLQLLGLFIKEALGDLDSALRNLLNNFYGPDLFRLIFIVIIISFRIIKLY